MEWNKTRERFGLPPLASQLLAQQLVAQLAHDMGKSNSVKIEVVYGWTMTMTGNCFIQTQT
jgi:hypothetical protein